MMQPGGLRPKRQASKGVVVRNPQNILPIGLKRGRGGVPGNAAVRNKSQPKVGANLAQANGKYAGG